MAAGEGFEPPQTVSETGVLPLDDPAARKGGRAYGARPGGLNELPATPLVAAGIAAGSFPPGLPALASHVSDGLDGSGSPRAAGGSDVLVIAAGHRLLNSKQLVRLLIRRGSRFSLKHRDLNNKKPFLAGPGRVRSRLIDVRRF